jgi:hypothetical protein
MLRRMSVKRRSGPIFGNGIASRAHRSWSCASVSISSGPNSRSAVSLAGQAELTRVMPSATVRFSLVRLTQACDGGSEQNYAFIGRHVIGLRTKRLAQRWTAWRLAVLSGSWRRSVADGCLIKSLSLLLPDRRGPGQRAGQAARRLCGFRVASISGPA